MEYSRAKHMIIGDQGEDIALHYLQRNQYALHERNCRIGRDEIDLVCFDHDEKAVVFAEVKTRRRSDPDFAPHLNLTYRKKQKMKRAAYKWIAEHDYDGAWRLDLICVAAGSVVDHLKGVAFED